MKYLCVLITLIYAYIFYVFYTFSINKTIFLQNVLHPKNIQVISIFQSIPETTNNTLLLQTLFWNLLYEVLIFLFIAFVFFFYFSSIELKTFFSQGIWKIPFHEYLTWKNTLSFLKQFSYVFAFLLFYSAIYFLSKSLKILSFSAFIFLCNIGMYLFFLFSKSSIGEQFIKINSILLSCTYSIVFILSFITNNYSLSFFQFLNASLTFLLFIGIFQRHHINYIPKQPDIFFFSLFSVYSVLYVFFFSYFLGKHLFPPIEIFVMTTLWIGYIWGGSSLISSLFPPYKYLIKNIGMLFLSISFLGSSIALIIQYSLMQISILFFHILYQFQFYKKYGTTLSFSSTVIGWIFLVYYLIFHFSIFPISHIYFSIFSFLFSWILILVSYIQTLKTPKELYFLHITSYLINGITLILLVWYHTLSFFDWGILLLWESLFFFFSYYRLTKGSISLQ